MSLLQKFVNFLLSQKNKPSRFTVKNYKADISQFIFWFEKEFKIPFDGAKVTSQIINLYKKSRKLSSSSFDRHTSSLRKFFNFLKTENLIIKNPLENVLSPDEAWALQDPWMIKNFKSFLYDYKKSSLTIKNYINDIKNFSSWFTKVALTRYGTEVASGNLLSKIKPTIIEEYKQRLIIAEFSPRTINRKLSSLRSYLGWIKNQGFIEELDFLKDTQQMEINAPGRLPEKVRESHFAPIRLAKTSIKGANFLFDNLFIAPLAQAIESIRHLFWSMSGKNIFKKDAVAKSIQNALDGNSEISNIKKEFYAPLDISTRYFPIHKRIWHHLRYSRPNWYRTYHSYSFAHYLHFSILMILSCAVGFGIFSYLFENNQTNDSVLGTVTIAPSSRTLFFQGKLTDSFEAPIVKNANILFSIYNSDDASPTEPLWQEKDTIRLDSDGSFSVNLGENTPIPETIFDQNGRLYLGITIENGLELSPRQQIATVSLASDSLTLRGLTPINSATNASNVVLALDSFGNLSIKDNNAHSFQVTNGQFILSGETLLLTSNPKSDGDIEIVPDGLGKIDFSKPIHNSSNNNNLTLASGSVEFDDSVGILATTSGQSALSVNQNSTGDLISAFTNGSAKFIAKNDGSGMFAGNLDINGGNLFSTASTFNLLNSSVSTLNIGGVASTINIGVSSGSAVIKSNLFVDKDFTLSSLSSNGGVLYANESGKVLQTTAGTGSDCLIGGSTPSFISCADMIGQISKVGIGTTNPLFKLDVLDFQDATASAQIYNASIATTAAGLIIKLGNTSTSVPASNHFLSFETAGIGVVGSVQGNTETGVTYATSGIADFAEYIKKDKDQTIEYGSVICIDSNGLAVKCDNINSNVIGVASEHPAFLGGKNLGNSSIAVGLTGQVETLVAITNSEIKAGDALSSSDVPGVAIKAIKAGQIIGKALENLRIIDESKIVGYFDPENKEYRSKTNFPNIPLKSNIFRVAKIAIIVNSSWYDPSAYLAQNGELIVNKTNLDGYSVSNSEGEIASNVSGFWKIIAANVKAGLLNTGKIITDTLIVTSDSIIINGENLRDYIVNAVKDSGIIDSKTISPIINTSQLSTDIISPLSSPSLIVKLASPSGSLVIKNSNDSVIAKIDDQGNASFSGQLSASSGQFKDASISGTLRAKNITADSIMGLEATISNIYSANFADLASYSAQLSFVPDLTANKAQFNQGLMVFGPTNLSDLSITERLSIGGTMFATQNSIDTLGIDLSLQGLRQSGLSIMGGLVYIDTQGNLKVQGDLSVTGKLAVNVISPLPTSDLVINNANGSSVLSINQAGDIISSGSGTFSKLNFNLIRPVLAVSPTEVIASSSAGITSVAPHQSEVTIKNNLVTSDSVIYITPVGTPSGQTPFLLRQIPNKPNLKQNGSFTVGVQSPTDYSTNFNWLIIN
jgi:site-specific recombinase XerD